MCEGERGGCVRGKGESGGCVREIGREGRMCEGGGRERGEDVWVDTVGGMRVGKV